VWLIWCLAELGEFAVGLCDGQVRLAEAASPPEPFQRMLAYLAAGRLHLLRGDIAPAIQLLENDREAQRVGNFGVLSASIASMLGSEYGRDGGQDDGIALLTDALEQASVRKSTFGDSLRLAYLAEAVMLMGRTDEALHHGRCALELARTQQEQGHEAYVLRLLAEITARQEPLDVGAAAAAYSPALGLAEELGMRPLAAH